MSIIRAPNSSSLACPGIKDFIRPTMTYVKCNKCGGHVEIWSDEEEGVCLDCGAKWQRPKENATCLTYCEYADKCKQLIKSKHSNS